MRIRELLVLPSLLLAACASQETRAANPGDTAHLDAMSREHASHTPVPNGSDIPPRGPVVAGDVEYVVDGTRIRGYEARPEGTAANADLPAVILIHEWWGLNDNVRMMARRLAGEGYRAFAVDLYEGQVAQTPEQARTLAGNAGANPARGMANLAAAVQSLKTRTHTQRIGIMGWCFGGGWALQGALGMPDEIDSAVMYYGRVVTDRVQLASLRAPLLGLFGGEDRGIPVDSVRAMEGVLRELGKDVAIQVYPGAAHAFANPSGQAYNAAAAEDAWTRTLAHFQRTLR